MSVFSGKTKVNIGVLGHIDSGKTALCGALSTILSTAALDKNPQSQERGITLDLQFSAIETASFLFTLTDCPGHASLIRTIIGGAQIIDLALMVIDVTKGIQTQTAEGLIIASVTVDSMVVVLNKVDLIPSEEREKKLEKLKSGISKAFAAAKFKHLEMVPFSTKENVAEYSKGLIAVLERVAPNALSRRVAESAAEAALGAQVLEERLLFLVDHCFVIKGKGTVATGTVLRGILTPNQSVYIPSLATDRKVKSIQMFHQSIDKAIRGDRVGALLHQFDAKLLERGLICGAKQAVVELTNVIVSVDRIAFYKLPIKPNTKFHVSVGHNTVMASCVFFGSSDKPVASFTADSNSEYPFLPELDKKYSLALMQFETPVFSPLDAIFIASKLDIDPDSNQCRLAFHGTLLKSVTDEEIQLIKIFKLKEKVGVVDRITAPNELIGRDLFKKETNMALFVNMKIRLSSGAEGTISGTFGKTGKFKATFLNGFGSGTPLNEKLIFQLKRYIFDKDKKALHQ